MSEKEFFASLCALIAQQFDPKLYTMIFNQMLEHPDEEEGKPIQGNSDHMLADRQDHDTSVIFCLGIKKIEPNASSRTGVKIQRLEHPIRFLSPDERRALRDHIDLLWPQIVQAWQDSSAWVSGRTALEGNERYDFCHV